MPFKQIRINCCRHHLVYQNDSFQGLLNLPEVASALADNNAGKNLLASLVGGITLIVVLAVISMLIPHIPDMPQFADRTMN
ncbi:MAG: hypothetical protein KZQ80_10995 [Candidatus Thiodiazotropha sp. (ex Monitilora ramsayi)]|nr:hypothetical protein [Candidatus Thiodiazotropha sp. (ex Monitilora ramsayi)]